MCPGGRVIDGPPGGSYWRMPEETLWELDSDKRIWWGEDGNNVPRIKRFLSEVQEGLIPQTVWDYNEVGHTQEAKQEYLRVLSDREVFTTPKPVELLKRIIQISMAPDDILLDSFAGSGTTGHAVLEMNKQDGGKRRFILVQMPHDTKEHEKEQINICQTVTAERLRRVISGYSYKRRLAKGKTKKQKVEGLGGSFTYVHVGEPLFGEYKDLGEKMPAWEDLARYVFYTETSRECDPKQFNLKTGFIGSTAAGGGTSYYLLYTPNKNEEGREMSLVTLKNLAKIDTNKSWVIYCEKIWLHLDQMHKFESDHNKKIRPMVVPFNLK
jgi:hypothetical protein